MQDKQFFDTTEALPEYKTYAMDSKPTGHHPQNCIFYHADTYTRISVGGYWLSESPHIAGSKSWDSAVVRLANWIRLKNRTTGSELRVINTHLDHVSQIAREHQARLIVEDSTAYPEDYPQILTGDMNCDFKNRAIDIFKAGGWIDTYGCVHGIEEPGHTYHEFLGPKYDSAIGKIDWIFMRGGMDAIGARVITDSINGRFPSDHYFVSATVITQESDDNGEQGAFLPGLQEI
jgi:endonuclease/exonuclease/phosphatase family metal-dependent hydrolase